MNPILDAPVVKEQRTEYAGFWIRVVAAIIDSIVLWIVQFVLAFAFFGGMSGMMLSSVEVSPAYLLYNLISFLIALAYFGLLESSARQATLGKMAVGIKVGDEHGQRITALNAIGRRLATIISFIILCIGYIMVAFDVRKQALHDKIASTTVYYG